MVRTFLIKPKAMTHSKSTIRRSGPGSFTTKAVHTLADGSQLIATSRRHRKGRGPLRIAPDGTRITPAKRRNPWLRFWAPGHLTWWVAVLFLIGSGLFALGGYGSTFPQGLPKPFSDPMTLNWIFFIGSMFFTGAAFCQLLEAINAGKSEGLYEDESIASRFQVFDWQPKRIGYLASLTQFIGTLMFNFNTGDVLIDGLNWMQEDLLIWVPNIIGCICFLVASQLAFMEVCHAYARWKPRSLSWWITVLNLLGSVGFMISALYGLVPPDSVGGSPAFLVWLAGFFTFQGALCFFVASYLLLPEMFSD